MFEHLPKITKEVAERLMAKDVPEFSNLCKNNPKKAKEEVKSALQEISKEGNPYLAKAIEAGVSGTLGLIEDRFKPKELEIIRVLSLKGYLLVCEALEAAAWTKEMEKEV